MKWFNLENIKNSSFFITPNLPIITTKRYKFSVLRVAAYLSIYTIAAWFLLIIILTVTPLKDYVFVIDNNDLKAQTEKIKELQNKVVVLTDQLQELASTNERMRYAMKLAGRDSIKPNDALYDTMRKKIDKKINIGGNIYAVFVSFIEKYFGIKNNLQSFFFIEPTNGVITQGFNSANGHMGIDFGVASGSPVYASAGGLIIFAEYTVESGYQIMIQHDDNYLTMYKHCSSLVKKIRERVAQGELIALSGNTGKNTTGPHLHFEIWQNGKPIDPQKILSK
ncbi:MAG: M23 family metallopeptidase [Ignavibacteriales bacterium]|nr:MAG: M23 family metallopeptidase [Ignavibacteriales bacterium]